MFIHFFYLQHICVYTTTHTYVCIFWMTISSRIMSFHKIFSTHIWYLFFAWVMRNGNWVSQKPVLIDPKSDFILKASLTWPLTYPKESIRQRGWSSIATKVSNVDNQVEVMVAKNQSLNVQFKFLNWFKLFSKSSDSYLLQVALLNLNQKHMPCQSTTGKAVEIEI